MTREEQIIETAKEYYNPKNGTPFSLQMRTGFITGAKWADEHPANEQQGLNVKEILYVAQKTAAITKKEIIIKACKWLKDNLSDRIYDRDCYLDTFTELFIEDFRKALEE